MRIELEEEILEVKEYNLYVNSTYDDFNKLIFEVVLETFFGTNTLESFDTKEEALEYMKNWNQ